uniref:Uncharacterized protein n=1 Tax=Siphoviridae sp. ctuHu10 TaxID=2826502 RepID=A0A8S5NQI3_9CAUD|nr:MAG TPA: hypothetical protein [Siphoviridae sp. ctuHu10]
MLETFDDSFVPNPKSQSNLTSYVIATYTQTSLILPAPHHCHIPRLLIDRCIS